MGAGHREGQGRGQRGTASTGEIDTALYYNVGMGAGGSKKRASMGAGPGEGALGGAGLVPGAEGDNINRRDRHSAAGGLRTTTLAW